MDYCFNGGCWGAVFAVPQSVVDNYIKLANESALKVLLYMLRNSGKNISREELEVELRLSGSQIEEAFLFWENANILSKGDSAKANEAVMDETQSKEKASKKESSKKKKSLSSGTAYSLKPSEIAERINGSDDIKAMFAMAETIFGRPLNHTEQRSFIWMYDYLGMPADVLITIVAYAVKIEKSNIRYIETIASDWADKGINNLELAQEEIKALEDKHTFNGKIMKMFCMKHELTSKQQAYVETWRQNGYSPELIEYAYEKTLESIEKLNFPYINKILENWYSQGLVTREKIDSEQNLRRANRSEEEHSYDLDEYKSLVNNFGDVK